MLSSFKNFITGDSILNKYEIEEQETFPAYEEACCKVYKTKNNFSAIIYEKSLISKARQEDFLTNSKWLMKTIHPSFLKLVEKVSHSTFKTILISERMVCTLQDLIVLYTSNNVVSRSSSDVLDSYKIHLSKITNILGVNSISDIESIFNNGFYSLFEGLQFLKSTKGFFPVLSPNSIFVNLCGEFKIGFITTNKPDTPKSTMINDNHIGKGTTNDILNFSNTATQDVNYALQNTGNMFEDTKKNLLSLISSFPKTPYITSTVSLLKTADPLTLQTKLSQDSHYQTLLHDIKAFPSSNNIKEAICILNDLNNKQQKLSSLLVSQSLSAFAGVLDSSYKQQVIEGILVLLDYHVVSPYINNNNNNNNVHIKGNEEFFKAVVLPHVNTLVKLGFVEYNEKYMTHVISIVKKFNLTTLNKNNTNNTNYNSSNGIKENGVDLKMEKEIVSNFVDCLEERQKLSWSLTLNFLTSSLPASFTPNITNNTYNNKSNINGKNKNDNNSESYFEKNKEHFERLISNVKKCVHSCNHTGLIYLHVSNVLRLIKLMSLKYNAKIISKFVSELKNTTNKGNKEELNESSVCAFLELHNELLETFKKTFRTQCLQNIVELVSTHKCSKEVFDRSVRNLKESVERIKEERKEVRGIEKDEEKKVSDSWEDMFSGLKTRKGKRE